MKRVNSLTENSNDKGTFSYHFSAHFHTSKLKVFKFLLKYNSKETKSGFLLKNFVLELRLKYISISDTSILILVVNFCNLNCLFLASLRQ